jgi:hypothetical protein
MKDLLAASEAGVEAGMAASAQSTQIMKDLAKRLERIEKEADAAAQREEMMKKMRDVKMRTAIESAALAIATGMDPAGRRPHVPAAELQMIIAQLTGMTISHAEAVSIQIGTNCLDRGLILTGDAPRPNAMNPGCWFYIEDAVHGLHHFAMVTEGGHMMRATAEGEAFVIGIRYAAWTGIPSIAPHWNDDGSLMMNDDGSTTGFKVDPSVSVNSLMRSIISGFLLKNTYFNAGGIGDSGRDDVVTPWIPTAEADFGPFGLETFLRVMDDDYVYVDSTALVGEVCVPGGSLYIVPICNLYHAWTVDETVGAPIAATPIVAAMCGVIAAMAAMTGSPASSSGWTAAGGSTSSSSSSSSSSSDGPNNEAPEKKKKEEEKKDDDMDDASNGM